MKRLTAMGLVVGALVACGGGGGDDEGPASTLDRYVGAWNISYTGADRGECTLSVSRSSSLVEAPYTGTCRSNVLGISFSVTGAVDSLGGLSSSSATTGARLSGSLTGNTGSGTWTNSGASGTWAAMRG